MFRSSSAASLPPSSETQMRFVRERIRNVEKHFGEMCTGFSAYARKIAGQRDKGDALSEIFYNYGMSDNISKNSNKAALELANVLACISDYRDAAVHRLESNIVQEISAYQELCKTTLENVQVCSAARARELARCKYVNKLRQENPLSLMQITKAESDLQQCTTQAMRLGQQMEERLDAMEKKKTEDFLRWMKKFVRIEMSLHAAALSLLTKAAQQLENVNGDIDIEEFRNALRAQAPTFATASPSRAHSVPSIALPTPPNKSEPKLGRSKSFAEYRASQRAESLDSLKVEEYEELKDVPSDVVSGEDTTEDEDEDTEEEEEEDRKLKIVKPFPRRN